MAQSGFAPSWLAPSGWFLRQHPDLPELNTLADFERYGKEVQAGRILHDIAPVLRQCDAVLMNGENFIRPGAHKGRMLLFLAYLVKQVFGKPCVLTNHSAELDEPALAELARNVYPMFDEVHFREERSVEVGAPLVRPGAWRFIPDVAFAVPAAPLSEWGDLVRREGQFSAWPDSAEGFDPSRPYVTVCASSIYSLPQHSRLDPVPFFIKLCRQLNERVGPVVLAAPCVIDSTIMRKVQAATGFPLLGLQLPVRQAIDLIGNAAVHVGGRWHPAIFAATGGTPTVALTSNNHKVRSLMDQLEMEGPVFDALDLDTHIDAIVGQARAYLDAGTALRQRLMRRSRELAGQVGGNLDWFRARAGRA
jgi:polysaccharide pyruvyl transferase WcaK-like protein